MELDEHPFRYGRPYSALVWRDRVGASVAPLPVARALRDTQGGAVGQPTVCNPVPNDETSELTIHLSIVSMTP